MGSFYIVSGSIQRIKYLWYSSKLNLYCLKSDYLSLSSKTKWVFVEFPEIKRLQYSRHSMYSLNISHYHQVQRKCKAILDTCFSLSWIYHIFFKRNLKFLRGPTQTRVQLKGFRWLVLSWLQRAHLSSALAWPEWRVDK